LNYQQKIGQTIDPYRHHPSGITLWRELAAGLANEVFL